MQLASRTLGTGDPLILVNGYAAAAALSPEMDRQFGDLVAQGRAGLSEVTLAAQERAMVRWHADEQAPLDGSPPTLAACGSEDAVIPPANNALLAQRWPRCEVVTIDGGGHAFMAQEPDRVARLIKDFLRAHGNLGDVKKVIDIP
jgi:pimeloyl-ACP methyl ester carboxylesterase